MFHWKKRPIFVVKVSPNIFTYVAGVLRVKANKCSVSPEALWLADKTSKLGPAKTKMSQHRQTLALPSE